MKNLRNVIRRKMEQSPKSLDQKIMRVATDYFMVTPEQIQSKSRKDPAKTARQFCHLLSCLTTKDSLSKIGGKFGGRNHATVIHSCKTLVNYMETDKYYRDAFVDMVNRGGFDIRTENIELLRHNVSDRRKNDLIN